MNTDLTDADVGRMAETIHGAQLEARAIPCLTIERPDLDVEGAYRVQSQLRTRYLDSGHRLVGWKAGLTSKAKMRQMGVSEPTVGFLTDRMWVPEGTVVETGQHVHPRVEAEIAFVLSKPLPEIDCTVEDVLAATAYLVPAIEIIDSRYEAFKFDLPSVIADNSSSARFVIGADGTRVDAVDRRTLGLALTKNGEVFATGAGAAVLGDPAEGVAMTARLAGKMGCRLDAGMIVLSGGITPAVPVQPGDVISARFQHLGVVDVRFA